MDKEKTLRKLREEIEEVREKFGIEFAEVKHGRWECLGCDEYRCSVCGEYVDYESSTCGYNYCPNCGADMRGNNDETEKK